MNDTADPPLSSERQHRDGSFLRKNRSVFEPGRPRENYKKKEFGDARLHFADWTKEIDEELAPIGRWFEGHDEASDRVRWVLRESIDEALDGRRTHNWCYQHLTKTEKIHVGTSVEKNLQREFDIADGKVLDWNIRGTEVDCKLSKDFGGWEIPLEMYRNADPTSRSGNADHPALLVWFDDDFHRWALGLVRITDARLKPPGKQGDNKRRLSDEGLRDVHWLFGGLQDLPPNSVRALDERTRTRVFANTTSGQERLNELFRCVQHQLISRSVIEFVGPPGDPMNRARKCREKNQLGKEGFLILGPYKKDRQIAEALGLELPAMGELMSCRVSPVEPGHTSRPSVLINERWWAIATQDEPGVLAPKYDKNKI
jgi:hypothetical protein